MIITCPHCETSFNIADEAFVAGRKAKCASCKNVFEMQQPTAQADPSSMQAEAAPASAPEEAVNSEALSSDYKEPSLDSFKPVHPKKSLLRRIFKTLAILICLAGLGLGGYLLFERFQESQNKKNGPDIVASSPETAKVEHMDMLDIEQYKVTNSSIGTLFVITGKVQNNFAVPKGLIKVEVNLLNNKDVVIASQQQFCGVVLSDNQLLTFDRDSLIAAITNRYEILANNTKVMPGKSVPFMVVMLNPPQSTTKRMIVKVVDAQDFDIPQPPAATQQQ